MHCIYSRFSKYPKIERYLNIGRLIRLRNRILVDMDFKRQTISHHYDMLVDYDRSTYKEIIKTRWNPYKNEPIKDAAEMCGLLRKIVNLAPDRFTACIEIMSGHPKVIIFYNFDYELESLIDMCAADGIEYAQWNGHKHQPIPEGDRWAYLVQYIAGAEGWNCIKTDTIIFFSQNYSYKVMVQAAGRIDRLNTPYRDLYYYHLKSPSSIDISIARALKQKKNFNERKFMDGGEKYD